MHASVMSVVLSLLNSFEHIRSFWLSTAETKGFLVVFVYHLIEDTTSTFHYVCTGLQIKICDISHKGMMTSMKIAIASENSSQ